jgi:predicted nucleic acid-binding protein
MPQTIPRTMSRTALFLSDLGEVIMPREKISVLGDKPDNRILKCAVTGHADVIVTGDRAMLNLKKHSGIRIISLRQFLDEIATVDL